MPDIVANWNELLLGVRLIVGAILYLCIIETIKAFKCTDQPNSFCTHPYDLYIIYFFLLPIQTISIP